MADLSKLQASVAKLQTDVEALIAQQPPNDQPAIDALTQTTDALDAQVVAKLNPTTP